MDGEKIGDSFDCLCYAATVVVMAFGKTVPLKVLYALCERYKLEGKMRELTTFLNVAYGGKIKDGFLTVEQFRNIEVKREHVSVLDPINVPFPQVVERR